LRSALGRRQAKRHGRDPPCRDAHLLELRRWRRPRARRLPPAAIPRRRGLWRACRPRVRLSAGTEVRLQGSSRLGPAPCARWCRRVAGQ
jgi:hypothetical protein